MTEFSVENLSAPMGLARVVANLYAEGEFNSWHIIKSRLSEFAQLPNAYQLLESAFDIQDHKAALTKLNEWREGVFSHLPRVSVLTDAEMQGALGGYSSELNTIFLSDSANRYDIITGQVLLEEYGHYLDILFNPSTDTEGDEGELFSLVALKKDFAEQVLRRIKSEDDSTQVVLASGDRYFIEASAQVTLFEHAEYTGAVKSFGIGNHAYVGNDFNDRATSIVIPSGSGLVAEVFEHANSQGRSTVISYSQKSIGADWSDNNFKVSHLNDQTSSIVVRRRRSDEVIFFQHGNFQGLGHSDSVGSKSQVRFNDDYSSIDLPDGVGIEVFEHRSFTGRSQVFTGDVSLIGLLNDQVSSYRTFPLASSYRVDRLNSDGNEGHRHTFKIFRTGNTSIAGQVRFSTSSGTATSGTDFTAYSAVRNFAPGQTEDVVYVDSRADNLNEGTERFNATISKVNSADTITTASTFGQIFNNNSIKSSINVNGQAYRWSISRFNQDGRTSAPIDPNKKTVLVSHGRVMKSGDSVGNLEQLATTSARVFSDAVQVLFLDWRSASADRGHPPAEAGKRIGAIANDVYRNLYNVGLTQAGNLYFYGHSLGSLLLSKVAERYGRIAGFASLDPAFSAEAYDLDNDGNILEDELPDLNSIASRSIALVAEDIPVIGVAGDNNHAMTAHRSYVVDFANNSLSGLGIFGIKGAVKFHNAVVDVFTGILRSGLDVDLLANGLNMRENQWGQDGTQRRRNSTGNYNADGVIGASFLNNSADLYLNNLVFVDVNGNRVARGINQSVSLLS